MFNEVEVITLFVDDIAVPARFYREVFQPDVLYEDDASCNLDFGSLMAMLGKWRLRWSRSAIPAGSVRP